MADWISYYRRVLQNPTATEEAKAEARAKLGKGEMKDTLAGTLETGEKGERELPSFQAGNLSIFKNLLKQVSERYAGASGLTGLESTMGRLGIEPEQISGGGLKGIVDFVKGQVTPSISSSLEMAIDLLESSRASAEKQINTLISTNGILELTDEYGARLWNMAGRDYEEYLAIKSALQKEAEMPVSWVTDTAGGRKVRIGFNRKGEEVQRTDMGAAEGIDTKTFEWKNLTLTTKQNIVAWLTKQEGYDLSWLKKLDEDPGFAEFIVSKYYQQLSGNWNE